MVSRYIFFMMFNCLQILTRAFVYISYFEAARWLADTEITQKSTSPDSILLSSMCILLNRQNSVADILLEVQFHANIHLSTARDVFKT